MSVLHLGVYNPAWIGSCLIFQSGYLFFFWSDKTSCLTNSFIPFSYSFCLCALKHHKYYQNLIHIPRYIISS